eukprot:jgi/Tetstr1/463318/TSEL_008242.t1
MAPPSDSPSGGTATAISAGGEHTLALDAAGRLVSWGACGLGYVAGSEGGSSAALTRMFGPKLVRFPGGRTFEAVCAGSYHNLALTCDGRLFSWGCGVFNTGCRDGCIPALGHPTPYETTMPRLIKGISEHVRAIAAGGYHSVALTEGGRVLTWGAGQLGQLGRSAGNGGLTDSAGLPVEEAASEVSGLPAGPVAAVGAAFYNTYALCAGGSLWCGGENQNRQCGAGPNNLMEMRRVAEAASLEVAQVTGGYCHTLLRDTHGRLFSLGCGDDGQRGNANWADTVLTEVPLPEGQRAAQLAAGLNHSLCMMESGDVYAWGSNEYGQLGMEGDEAVSQPQQVPLPGKAAAVSAGSTHSAVLLRDGSLYTMGNGSNGQLGNGSDEDWADAGPQRVELPS